jgi:hypothetical protein
MIVDLCYYAPIGAMQVGMRIHILQACIAQLASVPLWAAEVIAAINICMATLTVGTHDVLLHKSKKL